MSTNSEGNEIIMEETTNEQEQFTLGKLMNEIKYSIRQYVNVLIKNRKFLWIFLSGIISVTGTFFSEIAILTIINERTSSNSGNGLAVSAIIWCIFIPPMLMMPFTGVTADLFDQRKIMFLSDLLRAFLVPLFLIVSLLNQTYYLLYIILFVECTINAFYGPARESLVPIVISKKSDLVIAKSVDSLTWMFCSFIGSSLGGAITSIAGPSLNFIMDSLTFFASSFCIFQLFKFNNFFASTKEEAYEDEANKSSYSQCVTNEEKVQNSEELMLNEDTESIIDNNSTTDVVNVEANGSNLMNLLENRDMSNNATPKDSFLKTIMHSFKVYFKELFDGFIFLFNNPYLFSLCLIKSSGALSWASLEIISLKYADIYFRIGNDYSAMFGLSKALDGLGSGLMPVVIERIVTFIVRARKQRQLMQKKQRAELVTPEEENINNVLWNPKLTRTIIFLGFVMIALGFILIFVSPYTHISIFLIAHFIIGTGGGTIWVLSTSSIYLVCPQKYMGRIMSVDFGFFLSFAQVLSVAIAGVIYDISRSAPKLAIIYFCSASTIAAVWGLWAIICRHRDHTAILIQDTSLSLE